jgi:hypothetical protein
MAQAVAIIGLVVSAASAGVGAYSSIQQGEAADKASKFNANVAQNQAAETSMRAGFEAQQIRRKNLILSGDQRAAYAKSGVDISGSAVDVMNDSGVQGELSALASLWAGQNQSQKYLSQAKLDIFQGDQSRSSGYLSAGGTILSGSANVAGKAYDYWGNQPKMTTH